jgi:hypothetical protein
VTVNAESMRHVCKSLIGIPEEEITPGRPLDVDGTKSILMIYSVLIWPGII